MNSRTELRTYSEGKRSYLQIKLNGDSEPCCRSEGTDLGCGGVRGDVGCEKGSEGGCKGMRGLWGEMWGVKGKLGV